MLKKIKQILFLLVITTLIILLFISVLSVYAIDDYNGLIVENINIISKDANHIAGNFQIVNTSDNEFDKLTYSTEVYLKLANGSNLIKNESNLFSIKSKSSMPISFDIKFSNPIPKGDYKIFARIYNRANVPITYNYTYIYNIGSNDSFLTYNPVKTYFEQNNNQIAPLDGPSYNKDEEPILKVLFKNISQSELKGYFHANIYQKSKTFNPEPVFKQKLQDFAFKGSEEKFETIKLPGFSKPESYYVEIDIFLENGQQLSTTIPARYVVVGPNAKIFSSTFQNDEKTGTLNLQVSGSADGSSLKDVDIITSVFNSENNSTITKNTKKVLLSQKLESVDISFPLQEGINKIRTVTEIVYNKEILDKAENTYTISKQGDKKDIQTKKSDTTQGTNDKNSNNEQSEDNNKTIVLTDIKNTIYEEPVMELVKRGYISGYPDKTFKPDNNITRAEISTIICSILNKKEEASKLKYKNIFKDVTSVHWAAGYINMGKDLGIFAGYKDGTFKPSNNVLFSEVLVICLKLIDSKMKFDPKLQWPNNVVQKAKEYDLYKNITFDIKSPISRGKVALIINNTLKICSSKK